MKKIILAIALTMPVSAHAIPIMIDDFPGYYWTAGCTPTAAAMILGYWDMNGYDNLFAASGWDEVSKTENVTDEIWTISDSLGTKDNGATPWKGMRFGLYDFIWSKGYLFSSQLTGSESNWKIKWNIMNGKPILGNIHTSPINTHSIAIHGYDERDDGLWVASHNTWHESESVDWYHWDSVKTTLFSTMSFTMIAAATIPEPATGLLFGVGLLCLTSTRRRKT